MRVEQVMTRNVRTCGPDDSCNTAAQIMWEKDCGCVPVVDADQKVMAMITDRDICMAGYTRGQPLTQIPVMPAASHGVVTARATDDVDVAEALMRRHQIRRLPIVDMAGRLVGVLSMGDLARHAQPSNVRGGGLDTQNIVSTLSAVCQPSAHVNGG